MPRIARTVVPHRPRYVTQRGNNQHDVFFLDDDLIFYLRILKKYVVEEGVRIPAYCLMRDLVHVVAVPSHTESLATTMGRTHFVYTQHVNDMHSRSGYLWQNRFFSCPLDEEHL